MKSIKLSVLIVVITISVFSCKKEEESSPTPSTPSSPTYAEILTSGEWHPLLYTMSPPVDLLGNGNLISDITPYMRDCELDNFYVFSSDNTYVYNNGIEKCESGDDQILGRGNWTITANNKDLIFAGRSTDTLAIEHLTKDSLVIISDSRYDGNMHKLKLTYILKN